MDFLGVVWDSLGISKELRISIMRAGWFGIVSCHIAWTCGWLTGLGIEAPFARADALKDLLVSVQQQREDVLNHQIQEVRYQQCRTAQDSPQHQNYTAQLNELYSKYLALTRKEPRIPSCDQT